MRPNGVFEIFPDGRIETLGPPIEIPLEPTKKVMGVVLRSGSPSAVREFPSARIEPNRQDLRF
jgi:hypothetical protein